MTEKEFEKTFSMLNALYDALKAEKSDATMGFLVECVKELLETFPRLKKETKDVDSQAGNICRNQESIAVMQYAKFMFKFVQSYTGITLSQRNTETFIDHCSGS
jgi:hypothetical protein